MPYEQGAGQREQKSQTEKKGQTPALLLVASPPLFTAKAGALAACYTFCIYSLNYTNRQFRYSPSSRKAAMVSRKVSPYRFSLASPTPGTSSSWVAVVGWAALICLRVASVKTT